MSTSMRLRELIKVVVWACRLWMVLTDVVSLQAVRSCKTSAEERAVIARESARIRTSFANNEVSRKKANKKKEKEKRRAL